MLAFVDIDTTGLYPTMNDRIIEIAIITTDDRLVPIDSYTTLVNPCRDIGPTHIHGITSSMVLDAPRFEEIAGDIAVRLQGKVIVAHNAFFELSFLDAEFGCAGYPLECLPDYFCTLEYATMSGYSFPSRKLEDVCRYFDIPLDSHSAKSNAEALVEVFLHMVGNEDEVISSIIPESFSLDYPSIAPSEKRVERGRGLEVDSSSKSFFAKLTSSAPLTISDCPNLQGYFALLDAVLEDNVITADENIQLLNYVKHKGLKRGEILDAHAIYLRGILDAAWDDGMITSEERNQLECVRQLFGVSAPEFEEEFNKAKRRYDRRPKCTEVKGKTICFTGTPAFEVFGKLPKKKDLQKSATKSGMIVKSGVSKALDILVVSDPDSMSHKAKKARAYGTSIITEESFWRMILDSEEASFFD